MSTELSPRLLEGQLKLPPFWPPDPEVWFAQVEAQFTTRYIRVQRTNFDYIVASLAQEFATYVRDLNLRPTADNPYDTLKEQFIKRTTISEQRKLQQLFSTEDLVDRKLSQLLRRMQQLLRDRARAGRLTTLSSGNSFSNVYPATSEWCLLQPVKLSAWRISPSLLLRS